MSIKNSIAGLTSISILAAVAPTFAQTFPSKPVRIITSGAGGGTDFASRLIAQALSATLGQQVIVDNRGGGSGVVAAQLVMKSPPDGHTLLLFGSSIWVLPFLQDDLPYDPLKDFAPVTLTDKSPTVLVVHPSVPAKSVAELVALAKARPGGLNYARASAGGPPHLAAELFKLMAGVKIVPVPYKSGGPAVIGLVGGEVDIAFASAGSVAPFINSNRLKALAVTSAQPSALVPGVPTVATSGLPGYEALVIQGVFVVAGTPAVLVNRLHQEIAGILAKPDMKERFFKTGVEAVGSTPAEFAATLRSEMAKWGKVIKSAGIRSE